MKVLKFSLQTLSCEDAAVPELLSLDCCDSSSSFISPGGGCFHSWAITEVRFWDSGALLAVAPAVSWPICSPLSGAENFCSIRSLVTRVLLSSHLLGNKIRCLDCLARRTKGGLLFFPKCSFAVHFIMCVYLSQMVTHKNLKIKSYLI